MHERQRATDQGVLTVVAPITPGRETALRAVLDAIAAQIAPNPRPPGGGLIPFERLTTVHFARWLIRDDGRDASGAPIPAELVMATAYDAPLDGHLRELACVAHAGLDAIYVHCEGYPEAGARTEERIVAYLRAHTIAPAACFISTRWRTVAQIRAESALREALEDVLDDLCRERGGTPGTSPTCCSDCVVAAP
jgi:hypothetical protein